MKIDWPLYHLLQLVVCIMNYRDQIALILDVSTMLHCSLDLDKLLNLSVLITQLIKIGFYNISL